MSKNSIESYLEAVPRYKKRCYLKKDQELRDVKVLKKIYDELLGESLNSVAELELWIAKLSELSAAFSELESKSYVLMTCNTENQEHEAEFRRLVGEVVPAIKPYAQEINKKLIQISKRLKLLKVKDKQNNRRYHVFLRSVETSQKLYRQKNIDLQKDETLLAQEYQKLIGAMMVDWHGESKTLPQVAAFLESPDRKIREEAFQVTSERRLQDKDKLEDIFDKQIKLRAQIAKNAGFDSFVDYQFQALERFDYTAEDCKSFAENVRQHIVPLVVKINKKRSEQMKLKSLRPWDLAVDPLGRPALVAFKDVKKFKSGAAEIFKRLDPELHEFFMDFEGKGLLDLESRKGKAPGGYCTNFGEARVPFIFMNAVGRQTDVNTLLHECGHAFHVYLCRDIEPYHYRSSVPIEFCEVASMAMELLGSRHFDAYYKKQEDAVRARSDLLQGAVSFLPWGACIDSFQHWLYENPDHSRADRQKAWLKLHTEFFPDIEWKGLDDARTYLWHRQLHLFTSAFYYIEYCYAQLGAFGVWQRSLFDPKEALGFYKEGLALGGSLPLPKLFQATGLMPDFRGETLKNLVTDLVEHLGL